MKLYHLYPVNPEIGYWNLDCAWGFVVRAENEKQARELAQKRGGDESYFPFNYTLAGERVSNKIWLDTILTNCIELTNEGEAMVILIDFRAG